MSQPSCRSYHRRARASAQGVSYTPAAVARVYGSPPIKPPPTAPLIAILELGGGHNPADTAAAFERMGLPAPVIQEASVMGAANSPGGDADGEVALDVQVAAAAYSACTGQAARVLLIWCPNSDAGFVAGIRAAQKAGAAVLSISWGAPEDQWSSSAVQAMEQALASCVASGGAVLGASGDNDSGDGEAGTHVDYPASSPSVIGCGGTTMRMQGGGPVESVWSDGRSGTGGGYSTLFQRPSWQSGNANAMRGVPDVAGDADPATGYQIVLGGRVEVIGGTSAVAPLWAGLIAACRAAGATAPVTSLYANPSALNDITQGGNGAFLAGRGYDVCTGLGTPKGAAIFAALRGVVQPPPDLPPLPIPTPTPAPTPTPSAPLTLVLPHDVPAGAYVLSPAPEGAHLQLGRGGLGHGELLKVAIGILQQVLAGPAGQPPSKAA